MARKWGKETSEQTRARKKTTSDRKRDKNKGRTAIREEMPSRTKKERDERYKEVTAPIKPKEKEPTILGPTIELNKPEEKKNMTPQEQSVYALEHPIETIKEGLKDPKILMEGLLMGTPIGLGMKTKAAISLGTEQQMAKMAVSGGTGTIILNAKNTALSSGIITKILKQFGKPALIAASIGAIIGTYPWAEWAAGEAREIMGFTMTRAINSGDPEIMREAQAEQDEIFDRNVWEEIARWIPGVNIAAAFTDKMKAMLAQKAVNDKIINDEIQKIESGETDDDKWRRIKEEEAIQDKAAVGYYNEQRKLMLEWEAEANRNQRDADAEFWRKERAMQSQKEKEDREAISKFWMAYRKQMQKLADNSRPSNLNFGIL